METLIALFCHLIGITDPGSIQIATGLTAGLMATTLLLGALVGLVGFVRAWRS